MDYFRMKSIIIPIMTRVQFAPFTFLSSKIPKFILITCITYMYQYGKCVVQ